MFALGSLLLVASVCRECSGRFFTRHPDDTVAVTGHNVTLSCALNVVACAYPPDQGYIIYWNYQHEKTKKNYTITACSSPYKQFEKYAVSSHELKWTLHIRNVEQGDGGDYWCTVFSYPDNAHYLSESATLTAILPIKTAVQPAQLSAAVGESAAFHCRPYRRHNSMVKYVWYINGTLQEEETVPSNLQLSESGQNLTILMLTETFNNTSITCGLLSGKVRLTRQRKRALLLVYRETERSVATLYTSTTEMFPPSPSERQKEQDSRAVDLPKNPLSTGKYQVPSSTTPATRGPKHSGTDPGHKSTPSLQSGNPSVILIGGVVAAVFLLLVIAFLLYFLLFHNRRKADTNHARKTPWAQRSESGAAESRTSAETQLDLGDVAKACPQPTTAGTRLMQPPKQLTALEVTEDSKQHSSANKDQGKADESLAKDGAKLNTNPIETEGKSKSHTMRGKSAEALYAMPDKQFLKLKAKDSSQKANGQNTKKPKISGQKSRDDCKKPIIAVKLYSGLRRATTNQSSSDVKPPRVVPYHVAKGRAGAPSREALEPVSDAQEESKNDDPGQRNVENLVYADLDLRGKDRGEAEGASIICTEEETLYADIVNKGALGNLR